jgi:hypothetical protein
VVEILRSSTDSSLYELYAQGTRKNGTQRQPICGKGTAYKIKELYNVGKLQPYVDYVNSMTKQQIATESVGQTTHSSLGSGGLESPKETGRLDATSEALQEIRLMIAAQNSGLVTGQSRHRDRLLEAIERVRQCLHNPQLKWEPYIGDGRPLAFHGQNWALVPDLWAYAVAPDFSDEDLWGESLQSLKEHLKDSAFWMHWDELHQLADHLREDMDMAAQAYGQYDAAFLSSWEEFQKKAEWYFQISRVPDYPEEDWSEIKLPYDDTYARKVSDALRNGPMPGIYSRQWDLLRKLAELNKDLDPDTVEKLLSSGRCVKCFTT